jgi:hypothetical protein
MGLRSQQLHKFLQRNYIYFWKWDAAEDVEMFIICDQVVYITCKSTVREFVVVIITTDEKQLILFALEDFL